MFFVIISISIYIFGIYLILVLSNCNAIQSTDCHVRYFNKLSIYLSIDICDKNYITNNNNINFEEDSEKNSESQMGFEPTTLRDLVGCSNHLSYWRLYGEQGPICGSRLEPHHAATQPSNDWHTRTH